MRKIIIFTLLIVSFGLAAIFLLQTGEATTPPAQVQRKVLVAARPIGAGTLLREQDVKWGSIPEARVLPSQVEKPTTLNENGEPRENEIEARKVLGGILGAVARHPMGADDPVLTDNIVRPGERGFLAAVLTPGTRAVSVSITAVSGAAGLIFPGDRVDVMLTQTFQRDDVPLSRRSVGETVVRDLRVLAIDQRLDGKIEGGTPQGEFRGSRTVTVEVTPNQAEKVAVATELGKLSLSLRSLEVEQVSAGPADSPIPPTWADDVSPALKIRSAIPPKVAAPAERRETPPPAPVRVLRGSQGEKS